MSQPWRDRLATGATQCSMVLGHTVLMIFLQIGAVSRSHDERVVFRCGFLKFGKNRDVQLPPEFGLQCHLTLNVNHIRWLFDVLIICDEISLTHSLTHY